MASGSGTQQDPYIFNSFSELLELQSEATKTSYYEYGGTATEEDLNDIYPEGLSVSLSLTGIIDFKNLTIVNLRSFAQYAIRVYGALKNLTLNNIVWTYSGTSGAFIYGSFYDVFYNVKIYCTINCVFNTGVNIRIIHDTRTFGERIYHIDKCVVRLKGSVINTSTGGLCVFYIYSMTKDCNVLFDDFVCSNQLHVKEGYSPGSIGLSMIGCYIGGKITTDNIKDTYAESVSDQRYMSSTYNIFNVETEATFTHRGYGFNIFNSTKAPNFVSDTETNIIGVTDSQMKDALYLQSISFPCYRGE